MSKRGFVSCVVGVARSTVKCCRTWRNPSWGPIEMSPFVGEVLANDAESVRQFIERHELQDRDLFSHAPLSFGIRMKRAFRAVAVGVLLIAASVGLRGRLRAEEPRFPTTGVERISNTAAALEMLAQQFAANYEQLRTWSGTYRFVDTTVFTGEGAVLMNKISPADGIDSAGPVRKHDVCRGEFAINFDTGELFTTTIIEKSAISPASGGEERVVSTQESEARSIVTEQHYLHMDSKAIHGPFRGLEDWSVKSGRAAFKDPVTRNERQSESSIIDPRRFFWVSGIELTYGDYFANYAKMLVAGSQGKADFLVESAKGDEGTDFRVRISGHQELVVRSAKGFCPTSIVQKTMDGKGLMSVRDMRYVEQNGVFVPNRVDFTLFDDDGQGVHFERTWTLEKSEINQPLAADTFSYKQLGLQEGERVVDRIEGIGYLYRNGELTDAVRFDVDKPKVQNVQTPVVNDDADTWAPWRLLIGANTVAIIALCVVFAVRRWRSRSA
jgi:hypothetical protein